MRVRELYTNYLILFLFFLPRMRLRPTMPCTRTGIPLRSIPAGEGNVRHHQGGQMVFCRGCGKEIHETAVSCPHCGAVQHVTAKLHKNQSGTIWLSGKSKVTAGVLALLLCGFGIHKFYLGARGCGIVYILFILTWIPTILGLIEGIHYLTLSEDDFTIKASQMQGASAFLW